MRRGVLIGTYIIEVLCCSHDIRRLLIFVILHPALSKEFPVMLTYQDDIKVSSGSVCVFLMTTCTVKI